MNVLVPTPITASDENTPVFISVAVAPSARSVNDHSKTHVTFVLAVAFKANACDAARMFDPPLSFNSIVADARWEMRPAARIRNVFPDQSRKLGGRLYFACVGMSDVSVTVLVSAVPSP